MRRSRTEPDHGPHVRPGRRPIRRAASTAASSNRARRRRYAGQSGRGVEVARQHAPAPGRGIEVGQHVARAGRADLGAAGSRDGREARRGGGSGPRRLVVLGPAPRPRTPSDTEAGARRTLPGRPERDPHAVVVPRRLELAERQHAAAAPRPERVRAPGRATTSGSTASTRSANASASARPLARFAERIRSRSRSCRGRVRLRRAGYGPPTAPRDSKAAAAASTAASWRRRPTIWIPTGRPSRVKPAGPRSPAAPSPRSRT